MMLCKKDVTKAAGSLQLSTGQDAGAEAVIHSTRDVFADADADAVLLINTVNALNSINRKLMLHSLKFICPIIATYVNQFLCISIKVIYCRGRGEILSSEGTTQGEPAAMRAYALDSLTLMRFLLEFIDLNEMNAKEVAFADDCSVADSSDTMKDFCNKLTTIGPKHGYFPKPTKSYLIVKEKS